MDRLGPTDARGTHFDAYTDWHITWVYPYSTVDGQCTTGPVQVSVQVSFTLPQWEPPSGAPKDLAVKWDAYVDALQRHEDGHKDIAAAAGYEIHQVLSALPGHPTRDKLEQSADSAGERILDKYRQQELDYDQSTNHGATQGARFP